MTKREARKPPQPSKVSRARFDRIADALRMRLLGLQDQLKSEDFPVVIVFAGSAIAGKDESLNLITAWMDPRWIVTRAYGPPTEEERQRPEYWRYWRDLPPKGQIGLYAGNWYHRPVQDFAYGRLGKRQFLTALDQIRAFERTLAADGALILKFWLHMEKGDLKRRMKAMERDKALSWRIGKADWEHLKHHRALEKAYGKAISHTDTIDGRWVAVDGANPHGRALTILTTIRDALSTHIALRQATRKHAKRVREAAEKKRGAQLTKIAAQMDVLRAKQTATTTKPDAAGSHRKHRVLDRLDMSLRLDAGPYEKALQKRRAELGGLCRRLHFDGKSAIILFEGPDAAGKGGAIRRLTSAMDARDYRVIQIAAPTEEERTYHYLWRFWKHLPQAGRLAIYDRSWYGRVLVERVEGFALPAEWKRAYAEINDFEKQLTDSGVCLIKFWIHVTKDEQFRRFKERETISYKKWKLTPEDWRNREKWDEYGAAVDEMVARTSATVPWTLVEGNDKRFARLKVMETVCEALAAHAQ